MREVIDITADFSYIHGIYFTYVELSGRGIMTQFSFDPNQFDQLVIQRLPSLMRQNKQIQELVLELARENFAERRDTEDKFYRILNELERDREIQTRKWEEQNRKWEEQNHKWEEYTKEENRKWDEQNRKWEGQSSKWEEQSSKWDKAQQEFQRMHEEIMAMAQKQDRMLGALGARWGIHSENSFRKALAAILENSFGVEVVNVNEYDDEGMVFGRPEQIELDVIIKNGILIVCEIKSSISRTEMNIFERKVRFYERRHHQQVSRMLVISPMVDARALPVAEKLGIEVYTDSLEVKSLSV